MSRLLFILTIPSILSIPVANAETERNTSLGFGLGHPYGGVGANLNYELSSMLNLTAGLGTVASGKDIGWAIGARFYLFSGSTFRLTSSYGVVLVFESNECSRTCTIKTETLSAFSLGAGWGARAGESGWDFDINTILNSGGLKDPFASSPEDEYVFGGDDDLEVVLTTTISFGYHWSL